MSIKEIKERNRAIHKFMGYSVSSSNLAINPGQIVESGRVLKYHESWDWLMPVAKKLEMCFVSTDLQTAFEVISGICLTQTK